MIDKMGNWFLSTKGSRIFPLDFGPDDVDVRFGSLSVSSIKYLIYSHAKLIYLMRPFYWLRRGIF